MEHDFSLQRLLKWLKRYILKRIRVLKYLWGSFFGHHNFERFAIVGNARTGSNILASGLGSSNSIRMYHELFAAHNRTIDEGFEKIFALLFQKQYKSIRAVGLKLFYYHLSEDEWKKFLLHDDIRIIHLTRKNILRTIVSLDIAFKTDQWHTSFFRIKSADKKISLDVEHLIERIEEIIAFENITRERFRDRKILEIVYENLVRNPKKEFERIAHYLDITDLDPGKITLRKQNPEKLARLIENYEEVSQLLVDTKYEYFLYD